MLNEWKIERLSNLMNIQTGSKNTEDQVTNGIYPFFVRSQQVEQIDSFSYDCEAVLTAGDGVGTGKVFHYIKGKFDVHQRVYVMSNFTDIDGKFFYYWFSENFLREVQLFTAKTSVDSVRRAMISEMEILLPPLVEQKSIANTLSVIDEFIDALKKLIIKKQSIKNGTMQDLLTGKRRLPGFRGDWNRVLLGDVSEVLKGSGLSKSKVRDDGKYKCILYGELFTLYSEVIRSVFSRTDYNEGVKSKFGDVLIPGSTTTKGIDLARASTLPFDNVLLGGDINIIRPDSSKINPILLSYYISNIAKDEISRRSKGVTIYHIHGKDLKDLDLFIPSNIEEQGVIAEILNQMDSELESLELKLTKLKMIKQGMMQELLTGRIRLVTNSENMPATNSKPVF